MSSTQVTFPDRTQVTLPAGVTTELTAAQVNSLKTAINANGALFDALVALWSTPGVIVQGNPLGIPAAVSPGPAGSVLTVGALNQLVWAPGGASGATKIIQLTDAPAAYGTPGQALVVNPGANGVVYATINAVIPVNTLASIPPPNTLQAGTVYCVCNDATAILNGLWKVDGAIPGVGTGLSKV